MFNVRSHRLADQRTLLKKEWFSDYEILEICGHISREENA